jgi:hypothetical protein
MPRITLAGFAKDTSRRFILQMFGGKKIIGQFFLRKKKRSTIFKFSAKPSANFVGGIDLHRRQNMWLQQDGRAPSFPPRCETLFRHTVENNCRLYRVIINDCSRSRDVHVMKFLPVSCELSIFDAVTVIF